MGDSEYNNDSIGNSLSVAPNVSPDGPNRGTTNKHSNISSEDDDPGSSIIDEAFLRDSSNRMSSVESAPGERRKISTKKESERRSSAAEFNPLNLLRGSNISYDSNSETESSSGDEKLDLIGDTNQTIGPETDIGVTETIFGAAASGQANLTVTGRES